MGRADMADTEDYPFPATGSRDIQALHAALTGDRLGQDAPGGGSATLTRAELAGRLASAHNTRKTPAMAQTNADYLGAAVDEPMLIAAMTRTAGYSRLSQLGDWAGTHRGHWHAPGASPSTDNAIWGRAVPKGGDGGFQKVWFLSGVSTNVDHRGWNQYGATAPYIWGYDPKPAGERFHLHMGVTFDIGSTHRAIVWVTPAETFLEVIGMSGGVRRRTSASVLGWGQWTVTDLPAHAPTGFPDGREEHVASAREAVPLSL